MATSRSLPTTMVAWQHNPGFLSAAPFPQSLRLNQLAAVPKLGKNQTLVKVLSASINPVDYKLAGAPFLGRLLTGSPATPAMDYVGRVWATTLPDSAGIKGGDIVFGKLDDLGPWGTLASYTVVKGIEGLAKAPNNVELDWLSTAGVAGVTAYQSIVPQLETAGEGSARGKAVFINGSSGGVGSYTVQIAKALGVEHIVVTCSGANADLVKSLGATEVIDYRSTDVLKGLKDFVSRTGRKFDHAIDNAGADLNLYYRSHEYLIEGAAYTFVGAGISFKSFSDLIKAMTWPTVLGGGQRQFVFLNVQSKRSEYERLAQWMSEGKVKAIIDSTYSFEEVPAAYEKLKTGRARGNVVVRVSEDGRGDS